jgi:hypothetical protein
MYQELLEQIAQERSKYSESMQPPSTPEQISELCEKASVCLGIKLPIEYINFLKLTNGLDWNGLTIYASETSLIAGYCDRYIQGVIEANQIYRQSEGESGMDAYIYYPDRNVYHITERISLRVINTFSSFSKMLSQLLNSLLKHNE